MNSKLLSVIIPVYNCAPVITRCLDSIDYSEAEIIVVDDGSKDNSADVVRKYIENHPNVRLIQKENGGVSSARNVGIESATGKYIMFVDADDYLLPQKIERLMDTIENSGADVLKFSFLNVVEGTTPVTDAVDTNPISIEIIKGRFEVLKRNDVSDYLVWDGIYRRDLIISNDIRFHTDLHLHEDDVFMGELYCHVETVVVTNMICYCYVVSSSQSSTHNQNITRQRLLIDSGYMAIGYRSSYVEQYCPEVLSLERLKYMRWVCTPKEAKMAKYSLSEYKQLLEKFKRYYCWPLNYKWYHVARLDWSWKVRLKNVVKTFLCNHPNMAYLLYK